MQLSRFARVEGAFLPTPLMEMPRLTNLLGGPKLFIKRDDNTGLAFGGNKSRKLSFLVGDALQRGCDTLITSGGLQSNHCRQTAAMGAIYGLRVVLVLRGEEPQVHQANLLLNTLLGAEVIFVSTAEAGELDAVVEREAQRLIKEGCNPYIIPIGGSTTVGAMGYAEAMLELLAQVNEKQLVVDHIVIATGSGGTQGGLELGNWFLKTGIQIHGMMVSPKPTEILMGRMAEIVSEGVRMISGEDIAPLSIIDQIKVYPDYVGPGYAVPTPGCIEAIRTMAKTEGLIVDPVYTGKAVHGMIDLIRQGKFRKDEVVVFWHTGGTPGLFAYADHLQPVGDSDDCEQLIASPD